MNLTSASAALTAISLVRMVLGLGTQLVIAYYFGTSKELDLYFIANALPAAVTGLTLPVFSGTLIPQLAPLRNTSEFGNVVSKLLGIVLAAAAFLGIAGFFAGPFVLRQIVRLSAADAAAGGRMASVIWVTVAVEVMINYLISLLHLDKRFITPALLLMSPTIGSIFGILLWARFHGVLGMLTGWLIADCVSAVVLFSLVRKRSGLRLPTLRKSLGAASLLKNCPAVAAGILPFTVLPILDGYWTSTLPTGSMAYIGYASRISQAIALIVIGGIYTALLPYLSDPGERDVFEERLRNSIRAILLFLVPMCCFFYGFSDHILKLLLLRGQFDQSSQQGVLSLLPYYLLGVVFMAPTSLVTRAFLAKQRWNILAVISAAEIAAYFVLCSILINTMSYRGIGLAYSAYWLSFCLTSCWTLDKRILGVPTLTFALKLSAGAGVCVAVARIVVGYLALPPGIQIVAGLALTCGLFWVVNAVAIRLQEVDAAQRIILGYVGRMRRSAA